MNDTNEEKSTQQSYDERFISETMTTIKKGHEAYVYSKKMLEKTIQRLQDKKISHKVYENEDYWIIKGNNQKYKRKENILNI